MKNRYEMEMVSAKKTLETIENKMIEVNASINIKPEDAMQQKALRELKLDKVITLNEIEQIQSNLDSLDAEELTQLRKKNINCSSSNISILYFKVSIAARGLLAVFVKKI
jgi:L-lactate utilization protein LutC